MAFNPDEYLSEGKFNPDEYLKTEGFNPNVYLSTPTPKVEPKPFNPDEYLASVQPSINAAVEPFKKIGGIIDKLTYSPAGSAVAGELSGIEKGVTAGYGSGVENLIKQSPFTKNPREMAIGENFGQAMGMFAPIGEISKAVELVAPGVVRSISPAIQSVVKSMITGAGYGAIRKPAEGVSRVQNANDDMLTFGVLTGSGEILNSVVGAFKNGKYQLVPNLRQAVISAVENKGVDPRYSSDIADGMINAKIQQEGGWEAITSRNIKDWTKSAQGVKPVEPVTPAPVNVTPAKTEPITPETPKPNDLTVPEIKTPHTIIAKEVQADGSVVPIIRQNAETNPTIAPQIAPVKPTSPIVPETPTITPMPEIAPESALKPIIEQAGGKFIGIQKGMPAEGDNPAIESMVMFNDANGSTRAIPISKVTPEAVRAKLAPTEPIKQETPISQHGLEFIYGSGNAPVTPEPAIDLKAQDMLIVEQQGLKDRYNRYYQEAAISRFSPSQSHKYAMEKLARDEKRNIVPPEPQEQPKQAEMATDGIQSFGGGKRGENDLFPPTIPRDLQATRPLSTYNKDIQQIKSILTAGTKDVAIGSHANGLYGIDRNAVLPAIQNYETGKKMTVMQETALRNAISAKRGYDLQGAVQARNERNQPFVVNGEARFREKKLRYVDGIGYIESETKDQYKINGEWYNKRIITPEKIKTGKLPSHEEFNKHAIRKAKEYFGTTDNFNEAGYLTTEGDLLDLSGKNQGAEGGSRNLDHREINSLELDFPNAKNIEGSNSTDMIAFMEMGNIRFKPESNGFEVSRPITPKQKSVLARFIQKVNGEVLLDLNKVGQSSRTESIEYLKGTSAEKIFKDIDDYYAGKKIQRIGDINRYLYRKGNPSKGLTPQHESVIRKINNEIFGDGSIHFVTEIKNHPDALAAFIISADKTLIVKGQSADEAVVSMLHESGHKWLNLVATDEERQAIIDYAKKRYGVGDEYEAEEKACEAGAYYAKTHTGLLGRIKAIFDRIINRIKKLLGYHDQIKGMYDDMLAGKGRIEREIKTADMEPAYRKKEKAPVSEGLSPESTSASDSSFSTRSSASSDSLSNSFQSTPHANSRRDTATTREPNRDSSNIQKDKDVVNTPEFKKWFEDSKVVDENGKPLVVYHGTVPLKAGVDDFNIFRGENKNKWGDKTEYGMHFGTIRSAEHRIHVRDEYKYATERGAWDWGASEYGEKSYPDPNLPYSYEVDRTRIYPVYLKIKNPIRLAEDTKYSSGYAWHSEGIFIKLSEKGLTGMSGKAARDYVNGKSEGYMRDKVISILDNNKIDGIVYKNEYEGGGDSYLVFSPTQIKSATGNNGKFDSSNPDIRYRAPQTREQYINKIKDIALSKTLTPEEIGKVIQDVSGQPKFQKLTDEQVVNVYHALNREELNTFTQYSDIIEALNLADRMAEKPPEGLVSNAEALKDISGFKGQFRDIYRNFEQVFGKGEAGQKIKIDILDPFDKSKGEFVDEQQKAVDALDNNVVKKYGFAKGSKESAAIMDFGEKKIKETDLIAEFGSKKARQIVESDKFFRSQYDGLIEKINAGRKKIYGDMWEKKRNLDKEIEIIKASMERNQSTMDGKKRTDTLIFNKLQRRQARLESAEAKRIELMNSDEWWRGKVLPKRADYYRHWQEMADGLEGLINAFETPSGISPALSGISPVTKPQSRWAGIFQKRTGDESKRDAIGGFLNYIPVASYAIHIDPHIMKFRGIASELAKNTEETKNVNNFIEFLQDYSNDLAGKTNPADRYFQKVIPGGRATMRVINWLNKRVKANVILGNASSSLAQIFNVPQAIGSAKQYSISGATRTIAQNFTENIPMSKSSFIKERYSGGMYDKFDTGILKDTKKFAAWMVGALDEVGTKFTWNAHYAKAIGENMPNPIKYADDMTRKMVAGRGVGEVPLGQKAKIFQLIAPFQLEVANAWWVIKDFISAKDFAGLALMFVTGYLMNRVAEKVRGSDVVFDPINATWDGYKAFQEEPNTMLGLAKFGGRIGGEFLSNIPLGQTVAGMYPQYGANIGGVKFPTAKKLFGQGDPTRYGGGVLVSKGLQDPLFKIVSPYAGGQIKKSYQGIKAVMEGQVTNKKGKKLFNVNNDVLSAAQATVFGKYSSQEARDYFDKTTKNTGTSTGINTMRRSYARPAWRTN